MSECWKHRQANFNRGDLGPFLRLPGSFGSPVTPVATV